MNPLSPKANVSKGATQLYLSLLIGGSPFYLTAIYTLIVSYFKGVVKREIEIFSTFFALILSVLLLLSGVTFTPQFAFPLDNDSIPYPPLKCK